MSTRIPPEAFDFYVGLGSSRSYRHVATKYGISKRAVTKHAARENWPERIAKIEVEARDKADKKLAETLEETRERHLRMLRAMAARALEGLKRFQATTAMEAARMADMTIKLERVIAGEPNERTALSLEEVTRREIQDLLTREPLDGDEQW